MCSHNSGSKSGRISITSLDLYAVNIVYQIVTVRDLQGVRVSSLPATNEDGGSHHIHSCTPAHVVASGAALSDTGTAVKVL